MRRRATRIEAVRDLPAGRVVVCLGDSITQGQVSSNWVDRVQAAHGATAVVNAGVNGNLSWNVLQRLDPVIALRPDAVVLLIGTNDVGAAESARQEAMYRRQQKLPADLHPSQQTFEDSVAGILDRLQSETPARIAVLEIPLLGEDPSSKQNRRVAEYNASLHRIAAERGVTVLALFDRLTALLPAGHLPPPYRTSVWLMISSAVRHSVLRGSWDEVSRANGLSLLTDFVHLNDRAAGVVAELVDGFLRDTAA